jgi:3-oxoacyl-[acyl-carrier protein] reductase
LEQIKRRTPIGRLVSTEEVALAVKFLLAPESSGITGITLTVDGGASC